MGSDELELSMPLIRFRNLYYTLSMWYHSQIVLSILAYFFKMQQIMFWAETQSIVLNRWMRNKRGTFVEKKKKNKHMIKP